MESFTKPAVTPEQLSSICQAHLGDALAGAQELKDGWFNAAFLLISAGGCEAVLKTAPPDSVRVMRYERDLMRAEVSALQTVSEKTNVPVPAVIAYDRSRQIVDSDYFLTNRLLGTPLNHVREALSVGTREAIDRQVGGFLREMHKLSGPGFGTYNEPIYSTWPEAFGCLMEWLRGDAADLSIELPAGAFEAANPHLWALEEVRTPAFVHWDLWDGNIFVDPAAGAVTGLIDFERVLWADPLMEENFSHPTPALLEGYGEDILSTPAARSRRLLYTLYLRLIMVIECRFRRFDAGHEAWAAGLLRDAIELSATG